MKCNKCNIEKDINNFYINNKKKGYRLKYCNSCRSRQSMTSNNKLANNDVKVYFRLKIPFLRARAKHLNLEFDLTANNLFSIFEKQKGKCFYSDKDMITIRGNGKFDDSLSVDRINPSKGYTTSNIVLCTNKINTIKNNVSIEELKEWMPGWHSRLIKERKISY